MAIACIAVWLEKRGLTHTKASVRYPVLIGGLVVGFVGARYGGLFATIPVALAAAAIILMIVLPGRADHSVNGAAKVLEWLPLRYLGLISYSIYLWHEPVAWWVRAHIPHDSTSVRGWALSLLVVLVISVALATLTYFAVERPAMKLKKRTERSPRTPVAAQSSFDSRAEAGGLGS
jgi:peptidoglycan/LPS O-acetylase OafA/YrhL